MRVTQENIKSIKYIYDYHNVENGKNILDSLLIDFIEFRS